MMALQTSIQLWYEEIGGLIPSWTEVSSTYAHLGNPPLDVTMPVHSWFCFKESFSPDFPSWLVNHLAQKYQFTPEKALDPFVGSGTSLIELSKLGIQSSGVEYNPFIAWVAETKSRWSAANLEEVRLGVNSLRLSQLNLQGIKIPSLSTFKNRTYFEEDELRYLLAVRDAIDLLDVDSYTKDILRLGLVATLEKIANLYRDGRALRYRKKVNRDSVKNLLENTWGSIVEDLKETGTLERGAVQVFKGSATDLSNLRNGDGTSRKSVSDSSVDLVLYSPPYANNFDYSEVYKLELWFMGWVKSYEEWRELRRGTLRSHRSIKFNSTTQLADDPRTKEIAEKIDLIEQELRNTKWGTSICGLAANYFDDMFLAVKEQYRVLKDGGFMVFLLANSSYSGIPIETDIILAAIATAVGFQPLELITLKKRRRRSESNSHIRESVVILRKGAKGKNRSNEAFLNNGKAFRSTESL